jgi:hypothetical protein
MNACISRGRRHTYCTLPLQRTLSACMRRMGCPSLLQSHDQAVPCGVDKRRVGVPLLLSLSARGEPLSQSGERSWRLGGKRQRQRGERGFTQDPLCKASRKVLVAKDALAEPRAELDESRYDGKLKTDDCHRIRRCLEPRPAVSLRWPFPEKQHSHNTVQDESLDGRWGHIGPMDAVTSSSSSSLRELGATLEIHQGVPKRSRSFAQPGDTAICATAFRVGRI